MALGVRVFFGKVPCASPFLCAGILRKEVSEEACSFWGRRSEREEFGIAVGHTVNWFLWDLDRIPSPMQRGESLGSILRQMPVGECSCPWYCLLGGEPSGSGPC